ncbi:uncharacterized protein K444DRAFT_201958 [Hyaloscypha bicolor E]|uniref:Uncharacterized protein n=1 Tax=Hyaloscypha bicolor E TaxID=1095630 RepID=A0A2J6SPD7_9HELO|nr:uncharacterized protein K444DRAFT_201958 [Hyaloscypha bicolor E]PMD52641.1 hypothetical protein K444DRAFT_201958 [Hyaloscypha bicolor E]
MFFPAEKQNHQAGPIPTSINNLYIHSLRPNTNLSYRRSGNHHLAAGRDIIPTQLPQLHHHELLPTYPTYPRRQQLLQRQSFRKLAMSLWKTQPSCCNFRRGVLRLCYRGLRLLWSFCIGWNNVIEELGFERQARLSWTRSFVLHCSDLVLARLLRPRIFR